jgi:hypothetical protein
MLPAVLIVTRTMTITATAVMDTDQIMDTDHMRPRMDLDTELIRMGHMRVHTVSGGGVGGGDVTSSRHF